MFRLMFALFAFLWSAILDTDPGGDGDDPPTDPEKVELTTEELTQRTTTAAEAERKRLAEMLGVEPDKFDDLKAQLEEFRKPSEPEDDGKDDKPTGEDKVIEDKIAALLKPFTDRLGQIEQTEQQRQQEAADQVRHDKTVEVLKAANVRDDQLENAVRYASTYGLKVNDKGELEGSDEAIKGTKAAMPHAFRGDGDNGRGADGSGRKEGDKKPANLSEALAAHYSGKK